MPPLEPARFQSRHVECGSLLPLSLRRGLPRPPCRRPAAIKSLDSRRSSRVRSRAMLDWPHAPLHRVTVGGTYIVTATTHQKLPIFKSPSHLDLLCRALLDHASENAWDLQAWAAFPNHYHFVAASRNPKSLPALIRSLHSRTARAVNELDRQASRKVWFQYWDTLISNQRSYLARLHYVHENAVRHGVVRRAANYPWCSAGWFERTASPALRKTVLTFPCNRVVVPDAFDVSLNV